MGVVTSAHVVLVTLATELFAVISTSVLFNNTIVMSLLLVQILMVHSLVHVQLVSGVLDLVALIWMSVVIPHSMIVQLALHVLTMLVHTFVSVPRDSVVPVPQMIHVPMMSVSVLHLPLLATLVIHAELPKTPFAQLLVTLTTTSLPLVMEKN